jgi:Flp pilus assembly protein TadD
MILYFDDEPYDMLLKQKFMNRLLISILPIILLSACGGGGEFEPNYDENAMPRERRVDGELAFSSPSLMKMAESFRIAGDYTNAIRLYQRAANESPRHVTSRLALGQIYQRLGATDGAITYYQQVLDLEPDNAEAQLGLGQMMVQKNRSLEAIEYLEAAAEKSPDNFRIYNSIGLVYDLEGLHEQAQNAYGRGLSINPDHISLLNNLALSLAFQDEFALSIQLLSKAINLDYSQTTAQQNLVMVYALSGEEEAALTMASALQTPEEIDANMKRYAWLRGLSSKKRAQAIFLNVSSFPEDMIDQTTVQSEEPKTPSVVSIDPKRQMLEDILNSEVNDMASSDEMASHDMETTSNREQLDDNIAPQEETYTMDPEEMAAIPDLTPLEYYQLQLGSYMSEDDVNSDWKRLQKLAPELLTDRSIEISEVMTADNQIRYRLIFGEYDNFNAAQDNCRALQNKKVLCLVRQKPNSVN